MTTDAKALIEDATSNYRAQWDRYEKMAKQVAKICEGMLRQHAIRGNIQWRAKDPSRLFAKLQKFSQKPEFAQYQNANALLTRIGDLSALRIATYVETDRPKVVAKLKEYFTLVGEPDVKDGVAKSKFYRATHVQVKLPVHELMAPFDNLEDVSCEIQVCSMLAHVYNEIEHDLGYKPFSGELVLAETEALDAIGNIVSAGDTLIAHAIQRVEARTSNEKDPFIDQHDFIARTRKLFPDAESFADNAGALYDLLRSLGINSLNDLHVRFLSEDYIPRSNSLITRLQSWLQVKQEYADFAIRHVPDRMSSDRLMALMVESQDSAVLEWVATPRRGRPVRLEYLCMALDEMLKNGG